MSMLRKVVGAVALIAVAAMFGIGALALTPLAEASFGAAPELHGGGGRGFCGEAGLAAAATAVGLSTTDLQNQLRAGESLADVADTQGVELQAVLDAVNAACVQATRDAIAQAVTAGTLTQAKADWLNEGLDQGFWGPGTTDGGFGFGPRGGHGPGSAVTPTPAPSS